MLGTDTDSIINIKKRNISHRIHRLKQIKENHADHVAEIYFLQTGGNMMDYPTWRKKAQTPEFLTFMKQYRLEPNSADAPCTTGVTTTSLSTVTASPTIQTVGQQSHSQNTTQSQPPPLISTNSPHGKPNQRYFQRTLLFMHSFASIRIHSIPNILNRSFSPFSVSNSQLSLSHSLTHLLSSCLCLLPIANYLFFVLYTRLTDESLLDNTHFERFLIFSFPQASKLKYQALVLHRSQFQPHYRRP